MSQSTKWTPEDTDRAQEIWRQFQRQHDLRDQLDRAAGIDPVTARVWLGESAEDILEQLDTEGLSTPLYFVRVGRDYYFRKGTRYLCSEGRDSHRDPVVAPPSS